MMPKCPYFGEPCLKEGCMAYESQEIYVAPCTPHSKTEFKNLNLIVRGECLYRTKEICNALRIELPQRK